jgi:hypothetical protein
VALHVRDSSAWANVDAVYVMDDGEWKATTGTWVRRGGQWVAVLLASGGSTAPTASPSDVSRYLYAGTKIGVTWTNGDDTCDTRVYRRVSGAWTFVTEVGEGETTADTGFTSGTFGVTHEKNGIETAIVEEDA